MALKHNEKERQILLWERVFLLENMEEEAEVKVPAPQSLLY